MGGKEGGQKLGYAPATTQGGRTNVGGKWVIKLRGGMEGFSSFAFLAFAHTFWVSKGEGTKVLEKGERKNWSAHSRMGKGGRYAGL